MLWCKLIPWGLLGCHQAFTDSPGSALAIEQVKVVTNIAEMHVLPPPITVTVTVGVVATPVIHAYAAPYAYPTATPGTIPSYRHYDDTPLWSVLNTPLSYHDAIIAFGNWVENAGFNVDFRVTPLRLAMAAFMFGCLQLAFMILFRDYKLAQKTVKSLFRGFCSGSKVLWTLVFSCAMYLVYDTLTENPLTLAVSELLFLNEGNPDFVAHFVRGTVMQWDRFWAYSPIPRHAGAPWLWDQLFLDTYHLQQQGQFTPKTMTGLIVGSLVGLFRLVCAIFNFDLDTISAIWVQVGPSVTKLAWALPSLVGRLLLELCYLVSTPLIRKGYSWKSPLIWVFKTVPVSTWRCLVGARKYAHLMFLLYIEKQGKTPFTVDLDLASSYEQFEGLQQLALMSVWDMVAVIIENKRVKVEMANLEPEIRRDTIKNVEGFIKEIGHRAIQIRTSHHALLSDHNWLVHIFDIVMSIYIAEQHGINPAGEFSRRWVHSSTRRSLQDPENDLFYKRNKATSPIPLPDSQKEEYARRVRQLAHANKVKKRPNNRTSPYFCMPHTIDLFGTDTWGLDVHFQEYVAQHGSFASYKAQNNHVDVSKRRVVQSTGNSIEDYAAQGRVQEWYDDAPARAERALQLAHDFYQL